MLNISDIRKKLDKSPIPDEVLEIRQNITEHFKNLEFIEEGHKYFLHKENGETKEMQSVSSVCHMFEPFVDWEEILERKSLTLGVDKEELRREWHEKNITSTSNGTLTHLFAEGYMHFFMGHPEDIPEIIRKMQYEDGFLIPYGNKQKAVAKYYKDMFLTDGLYPVMPEAQIYIDSEDNPYGIKYDISGTFDALFAFKDKNGKWKLSIRDWKTNGSLLNDYNENNRITLLSPFDSLDFIDEPKSVYTIQLSLYSLGLKQLGYEIVDRKLLWLKENGQYEKIDVPDVTKRLVKVLKKENE